MRLGAGGSLGLRVARSASLAVADQVFLSLASFGVAMATARTVDAEAFGQFALYQLAVITALTAYRAVPGSWILTRRGIQGESGLKEVLGGGVLLGVIIGTALGLALLTVGLFVPSTAWSLLLPCALALLPLLAVETFRLNAYRQGRPGVSLFMSAVTFFVLAPLLVLGEVGGSLPKWLTPMASYAGVAAALAGVLIASLRPKLTGSALRNFLEMGRGTTRGNVANFAATNARQIVLPAVVSAFAGMSAVAGFRGAQTMVGLPLQVPQGLHPLFLAVASQKFARDEKYPMQLGRVWAVSQVLLLGAAAVASLFIPRNWGEAVLGDSWLHAEPALWAIVLGALVAQLIMGHEIYFRVVGGVERLARVRFFGLVPTVMFVGLGAVTDGARGAAIGLLLGNLLTWVASARVARASQDNLGSKLIQESQR